MIQICRIAAKASVRKMAPVTFAPLLAALVYMSVNLLAIRYVDKGDSVRRHSEGPVHASVVNNPVFPNSDHWPIVQQILANQHLSDFRYPPGFAIYMVVALKASEHLGGSYFFWRLIEDSFSTAATTLFVIALMLKLTDSNWIGLAATVLLLYNLTYSAGTVWDLAMASFLPWFYGALLLLISGIQSQRKRAATVRFFISGSLIGVSGFIRPDILLFLPFISVILWIHNALQTRKVIPRTLGSSESQNFRLFLAAFAGFGLILAPWVVFTSMRSGAFVVYSTNFLPSHLDGLSRIPGNSVSETFAKVSPDLKTLRDVFGMHYALIRAYPSDWATLWLRKIVRPWYASDSGGWNGILAAQSLFILPSVAYGMYLWWKKRGLDLAIVFALGVIIYFWLISISVLSINRYMPPVYAFLGVFVGAATRKWTQKIVRQTRLQAALRSVL
jgi:hypothetical protein